MDAVPWGQLITIDIFFIGLSAGAIVVSALCYVLRREEYKPIGRIAVYMGLLLFAGAMVSVVLDLGRPEKFWRPFACGSLNNPDSMFAFAASLVLRLSAADGGVPVAGPRKQDQVGDDHRYHRRYLGAGGAQFHGVDLRPHRHSRRRCSRRSSPSSTSPCPDLGTALLMIVVTATFKFARRPLDTKIIIALGRMLSVIIIVLFVMVFFDKLTHIYFPAREGVIFCSPGPTGGCSGSCKSGWASCCPCSYCSTRKGGRV